MLQIQFKDNYGWEISADGEFKNVAEAPFIAVLAEIENRLAALEAK